MVNFVLQQTVMEGLVTCYVGLYYSLTLFALAVRVKANTVSSVNPQFTATLHYFFTNGSVSKSKSKVSNQSNFTTLIQEVFQQQSREARD